MRGGRASGFRATVAGGLALGALLPSPAVTDPEHPSRPIAAAAPAAAGPEVDAPSSAARVVPAAQLTLRERREMLERRARRYKELRERHREWAVDFVARFVGTWRFEVRPSAGSGYWQPTRRGRRVYSTSDIDLRLDWWEEYEGEEGRRNGFLGFDNASAIFYDFGFNHRDDATGFITGDFNASGESITFKDVRLVPSYEDNTADFRAVLRFHDADHFTFTMMYPLQAGLFIEHWEADFVREAGE